MVSFKRSDSDHYQHRGEGKNAAALLKSGGAELT